MRYLLEMGFTRDAWMHRIDLSRAVGQQTELTAIHDRRIIVDMVREWATGDVALTIDAVQFIRTLSGRGVGAGLLAYALPL